MYAMEMVAITKVWRHVATDSRYVVEGFTRCSTNGDGDGQLCVSYVSCATGERHHRAVNQFLDGRFEPAQCGKNPGGEACCMPAGHEGSCQWSRGD